MKNYLKTKIKKLTPFQLIVYYYFLTVSVSTLFLSLPLALKPGVRIPLIDTIFVAASAVSVTGLSTINISETFSTSGIVILMLILQVGGIGIMSITTFFWLLLGKKIGLKQRKLIMTDQNQMNLAGLVKMLKMILLLIILIELCGALILGTYFLRYYPNWQEAYLHGLFSSISATTNAGFDLTGQSLIPFAQDYFVQFINMILITLGAIGFPVLMELKEFLFRKKTAVKFHFSLFTKITTSTYAILLVFGTITIFLIEKDLFLKGKEWYDAFFYTTFQSNTTRSAGLVTMDINEFSTPTLLIMAGLMFIGASPSSVGGGIRTTTFAIIVLFFIHFAKGNRNIKIFKREIHEMDVLKALAVFVIASFICVVSVILLSISEDQSLLSLIFEVCSAFGTTGASLGITPDLTIFGKCLLIVLMFIGRVGLVSLMYLMGGRDQSNNYHYPKERLIIG
ncbi:TrkH family potassium uptake protein [Heyndrickxia oleronia]|jgi:Trk-type K+ transport system membrane component|nr:TrkH family potassium uptake protein [Heyndrickxia oleronia]NYV67313.1 TrkH family potassium uptake protein [Bacillus sp. Gen3]OJH17837.1 Ktr system potassium uptake protein D [Bacillus obstructivus]MBU5214457.1 TrkH family potassium uptake protein [Heyndrickxia oleronia]MCI1589541.1 TrkH family potassium uptake protein [Heyndrickxia oleronia]MCI1611405.1 TrkH family potassium uptake protein [Heyndrickxia oleronia]